MYCSSNLYYIIKNLKNFSFFFEKLPFHKTVKPSSGMRLNQFIFADGPPQILTGCTECGSEFPENIKFSLKNDDIVFFLDHSYA